MSKTDLDISPDNRRKTVRKRTLQRGKIVYGDGAYTIDCLIRDISVNGARITVQKGISMPTHVYLIDIPGGIAYAAEVASIRSPAFGLRFLRTHKLTESIEPSLRYLQRCWSGCAR
jgi:hypothetical protein